MDSKKRREDMMEILKEAKAPIAGTTLAGMLCVSRQVIVQDIALLRATNKNIMSTNKGYLLFDKEQGKVGVRRVFSVKHLDSEMGDELNAIVDQGAKVLDVIVEHEVYGQISVDLYMTCRSDVEDFLKALSQANSKPLKILTSNRHYHTVEAENERIIAKVESALLAGGYLIS